MFPSRFTSTMRSVGGIVFSVAMGFALGGLLIWSVGGDPLRGYEALVVGAFGNPFRIGQLLTRTTPILLIALGTIFAFRASVWNVGQDGQFYFGALAATWLGVEFGWLPSYILIVVVILGGFLLGSLWSGLAGYFKARLGMDEILTTLMMNFIAVLIVDYLVTGPMKDPLSMANPVSPQISPAARLPFLVPGTYLHAGFILALAAAPLTYVLVWKTTLGYRLRAAGLSRRAAEYGGMNVFSTVLVAMLISGGLSGIAGAVEVSGVQHRLFVGISPGYWVMGIVAALLGKLRPAGVVLASLFISVLFVGADEMVRATGISTFLVFVIEGIIILVMLTTEKIGWFREKVKKDIAR